MLLLAFPLCALLCRGAHSFLLVPSSSSTSYSSSTRRSAFANGQRQQAQFVDANTYNVDVETAAQCWTVSVSAENQLDRAAGIPYLDVKDPRTYGVDTETLTIQRKVGEGLGLDLLELAGGREDGVGLTMVQAVSGVAQAAGVLPGDALASIQVSSSVSVESASKQNSAALNIDTTTEQNVFDCECRDFDTTMATLVSALENASDDAVLTLSIQRIRRWPKITVAVEYPPSQCANPDDRLEVITLTGGENLRRGLLNRRIQCLEDPLADRKCDYCGSKCTVRVVKGMHLLSPMSTTEQKLLRNNPGCRVSCTTVVGYGRQEGELRLQINLNEWTRESE